MSRQTFYIDRPRPSMECATKGLTIRQEASIYRRQLQRTYPALQGIVSWVKGGNVIGFRFRPSNLMSHTMYRILRARDRWDEQAKMEIKQIQEKVIDV